ncbi:hypothetical protein ABZ863_27540 [Saccharomonospora sp. NPDC046836]|uniref:hypothetical protein n=1 Tax=Saccharomonospora sp. NPDC046836 TaxID=3156921 RepID=UPI0033FF0F23
MAIDILDRRPVADVAVVWTEQNTRFHGREDPDNTAVAPYRGVTAALTRARITYVPVHLEDLRDVAPTVQAIVLPDIAVMTDEQCASVAELVENGTSLVATGSTALKDADGVFERGPHRLGATLGIAATGMASGSVAPLQFQIDDYSRHDYVRIDRTGGVGHGIDTGDLAALLAGFEDTDLLPLGGRLEGVEAFSAAVVGTHVEPFPAYPPELAWLRPSPTTKPVLVARRAVGGARIAYSAADIDRLAGREGLPDHVRLLTNIVRWAVGENPTLDVTGPGLVDCRLYTTPGGLVLHLVSIGTTSPVPGTHDEPLPVGPLRIRIRHRAAISTARALVANRELPVENDEDAVVIDVPQMGVHEVIALVD